MCYLCLKDGIGPNLWELAHKDEKGKLLAKAKVLKDRIAKLEQQLARGEGYIPAIEEILSSLRKEQYELARQM